MNKDIIADPIEFAIQEAIKKYERIDNEDAKFMLGWLERGLVLWQTISVHCFNVYGMTFDTLCEYSKKKKNIMLLTNEEVDDYYKGIRLLDAIKRIDI